jgi:hypothetical protein
MERNVYSNMTKYRVLTLSDGEYASHAHFLLPLVKFELHKCNPAIKSTSLDHYSFLNSNAPQMTKPRGSEHYFQIYRSVASSTALL